MVDNHLKKFEQDLEKKWASLVPTPIKEIFSCDHCENMDVSSQTSHSNLSKILYFLSSIISIGLVPLAAYGISKLMPFIVLPALFASDEEKSENKNEKKIFFHIFGSECQEFDLKIKDEAIINGVVLFKDPEDKDAFINKKTEDQNWVIRFNGNNELYESNLDESKKMGKDLDANVLIFNYRGVGESIGHPTKPQDLISDGEACIKYLLSKGVKEEKILVIGQSLGGGVGVQVASHHKKIGLISDRSFSTFSKAASAFLKTPLAGQLVIAFGWELNSVAAYRKIKASKLIVYHEQDEIIPYHYQEASLYKFFKVEYQNIVKDNRTVTRYRKNKIKDYMEDEALITEYKPSKVKLKMDCSAEKIKANVEKISAHNYYLSNDSAYPEIQEFAKKFFESQA